MHAPSPQRRIRPWMLVSAAWIVPALFGVVDAFAQQRIWGRTFNWHATAFAALDWLVYGVLTPLVFLLARRFPVSRPHLPRNATLQIGFSILFCFAWAGAGTLLKVALQPETMDGGAIKFYVSWVFTTLPFGVAIYLAMVGAEHAVRYFLEARARDAQVALLSGQLSTARLAALQAQLNPHFLFNSLNTISVLVKDGDPAAATSVIEQLSDVLRATLSRSRDSEVTLDDELALVRQYVAVERARFPDRLRPEFDVAPAMLSASVPSFALQHLVENALRHGIAKRSDAGRIVISARRDADTLALTVTDDGPGVETTAASQAGHGLANTRERLATLYGDAASLDVRRNVDGGTIARMRIPYREMLLDARIDADR